VKSRFVALESRGTQLNPLLVRRQRVSRLSLVLSFSPYLPIFHSLFPKF
jgi:hypothetical protein